MKFLLPTGIGDSVWAMHKIESVRKKLDPASELSIYLSCGEISPLQARALDFIRRFDFVDYEEM